LQNQRRDNLGGYLLTRNDTKGTVVINAVGLIFILIQILIDRHH